MRYDLLFVFYNFLHILPPQLIRLFCPRTVPFGNYSKFFVKSRHQTWSVNRFWKFSNSRTWISQIPTSWKIYDFLFWPVFNASKKTFRVFCNSWICDFLTHFQVYIRNIYIVLYGYKLFLTSSVGLKVKKNIEVFAIFAFLPFLAPYRSSKAALW